MHSPSRGGKLKQTTPRRGLPRKSTFIKLPLCTWRPSKPCTAPRATSHPAPSPCDLGSSCCCRGKCWLAKQWWAGFPVVILPWRLSVGVTAPLTPHGGLVGRVGGSSLDKPRDTGLALASSAIIKSGSD